MRFTDCWILGLFASLAFAVCGMIAAGLSYAIADVVHWLFGLLGIQIGQAMFDLVEVGGAALLLPFFIGETVPSLSGLYIEKRFGKRDALLDRD